MQPLAAWAKLPPGVRRGFYLGGYHLLLRDHDRNLVETDILAWLADPSRWLPSGADIKCRRLASRPRLDPWTARAAARRRPGRQRPSGPPGRSDPSHPWPLPASSAIQPAPDP